MSIWMILEDIEKSLEDLDGKTVDRKIDGLLAALSETIADVLPTASQDVLRDGAAAARRALSSLSGVEDWSTNFMAGQLATVADVLGFAAGRAAGDEVAALAARAPYLSILSALAGGALSNTDLSRTLSRTEEHVCRLLKELRQADLITTERRGRNVYNVLTPLGRLLLEGQTPVRIGSASSLSARGSIYQLNTLTAANDIGDAAELPRLSMAA